MYVIIGLVLIGFFLVVVWVFIILVVILEKFDGGFVGRSSFVNFNVWFENIVLSILGMENLFILKEGFLNLVLDVD